MTPRIATALMVSLVSVAALASCRSDPGQQRPGTASNYASQTGQSGQKSLSGVWGGVGKQSNGSSWTVVINLTDNNGTVDYASIPCSGVLKLVEASASTVTLRESITKERKRCVDNGKVVLRSVGGSDDELQFTWYTDGGKEDASARLKKFRSEADAGTAARNLLSGKSEPAGSPVAKPQRGGPPVYSTFGDFLGDLSGGKTSHVTDMQADRDGNTYVLSTRLNNAAEFRKDPDGTKSFLSDVVLTRIGADKTVTQVVLGTLYCCDAKGFAAQRGALKIDGDTVVVFYTEKEKDFGYGQNAVLYKVGKDLVGQSVYQQPYFHSANWGWFPYFDQSGTLQHFSFAGYYAVTERNRGRSIAPNDFKNRMLAARMSRAGLSGSVESETQLSQAFLKSLKTLASAKAPIVSDNPVVAQPFAAGAAGTASATAESAAAPLNNRTFPAFMDIPADYTITTNKGCRLNNPSPKPNETATWSGACRDGYADGHGTLAWFRDGKPNGEPGQHFMSKGFFLAPYAPNDLSTQQIRGSADSQCSIILPIDGVERMKSLFDVEYEGRCPRNASTLIHTDQTKTRANILFNGKLFATFDGSVTKGAIPVSGEMRFFNGSKFVFNGSNPFSGILTSSQIVEWQRSIEMVRASAQTAQVPQESFDIKVGFNAKPAAPVESSEKVLFFQVDGISGATALKMRYDIAPAKKAKLTAKGYVMSLKAEVRLDKTTSMGWFGVGENSSIVKMVDVPLDKKNGYRASGEVLLSELQSYAHGLGVTVTTKASRPTVTVVSISEEP